MKKIVYFFFLFCTFHLVSNGQKLNYEPGILIVKYKSIKSNLPSLNEKVSAIERQTGQKVAKIEPMFPWIDAQKTSSKFNLNQIYKVRISGSKPIHEIVNQLALLAEFEYVQPNWIPELLYVPNDPGIGAQYYLSLIKAFDAFDITKGDSNIVIGIVDTGVDLYHNDLSGNIKINYNDPINGIDDDLDGFVDNYRGWDLGEDDNNPQNGINQHGTYVSGMASAVADNGIGIAGVGYNTKIMPIKAALDNGYLNFAWEGVVYAADHGCKIINCSWGDTIINPLGNDVINYAIQYRNCLVVAAAGNARTDKPYFPASYEGVLSVTATNYFDFKWSQATYGITVDIGAPGEAVYTTTNNNNYSSGWGTSFASPLVAGAAALVWAHFPQYTAEQVAQQLRITADIIDTLPDNQYYHHQMGYGRLNILNALTQNSLPAIRINNYNITSSGDGFFPGDTLSVNINIINYLAQCSSTAVQITTESSYVEIINNSWIAGLMKTFDTKQNNNKPFKVVIANNIPENETIRFWVHFKDQGYTDYQAFEIIANPSFMNVKIGSIATTFTSNGKIGYYDEGHTKGLGFVYNDTYRVLDNSGLIVAQSSSKSASAALSDNQFITKNRIDSLSSNEVYWSSLSTYSTGNLLDEELTIRQESRIYRHSYPSTVFNFYQIINHSSTDFEQIKVGLYADWDIIYSKYNKTEYQAGQNLLYTYNLAQQGMYTGLCLLNDYEALPYAFDIIKGGNGGIDISDGFSNEEKWFAMNNPRFTAGNDGDSLDAASLLSTPFITIPANDTAKLAIAMLVADSYYDLVENARKARELFLYDDIMNEATDDNEILIYPNPAKINDHITFYFKYQPISIVIYNQLGEKVYLNNHDLSHKLFLPTNYWEEGIYFMQIKFPGQDYTGKFLLTH